MKARMLTKLARFAVITLLAMAMAGGSDTGAQQVGPSPSATPNAANTAAVTGNPARTGVEVPITSTSGTAWEMTLPAPPEISSPSRAAPNNADTPARGPTPLGQGQNDSVSGPVPAPVYTGEPISVDLKDVELQDFFRLIHEISGLNIVLDPSVKGTLTIVLDDVPWDQAVDIVLQNNGLDKQIHGNVLRIATKETLQKEAEDDRALAKARTDAAPIVPNTRVLSYAKSDDLAPLVKKFLTARGNVLSDPRSNLLIIYDVPAVMPLIDRLLKEMDQKSKQVEIEVRVVSANKTFSKDLGSQFAFAFAQGNNSGGGVNTVGLSPDTHSAPTPPLVNGKGGSGAGSMGSTLPLNTNLAPVTPTSGISYLFQSTNFALDYIISAAESRGEGKLLSKPRVATQNNVKAEVKQGVEIPIQTIVNNTISVQYVDAVLELEVTPQVTADGNVFLDVHVENTQIDPAIPRVEGIPALDTEAANTKILISNGGTVVIGGIIISSSQTSIDQVPYLGSIPFLGNLFKHLTVMTSSQELLFFLTPRILPG